MVKYGWFNQSALNGFGNENALWQIVSTTF